MPDPPQPVSARSAADPRPAGTPPPPLPAGGGDAPADPTAADRRLTDRRIAARFRILLADRIEQGGIQVPVVAESARELMTACYDESVEVEDLRELVERDPSVCAHILRVANSAAYSPAVPILSVSLAITRLGLDTFRQVALTAVVQESLVVEGWTDLIDELWTEAAVMGRTAQAVSRRCGGGVQRASLFGMLQDIGKPVVLHLLTEACPPGVEIPEHVARLLMEEFHAVCGAEALRQWSMPVWLRGVIGYHHDYGAAGEFQPEARVAYLSDRLACHALRGAPSLAEIQALPVCRELGLAPKAVEELAAAVERFVDDSRSAA